MVTMEAHDAGMRRKLKYVNVSQQFCDFFSSSRYPDVRRGPFPGVQGLPAKLCISPRNPLSDHCETVRISFVQAAPTEK
jgi:hypothetical protein